MDDFKEACLKLREALKEHEGPLRGLLLHPEAAQVMMTPAGQERIADMKANVMLAYRHLEDCRMRLGKAIQAFDGGTSVYPR
jgi:hypothetical protein